MAHSPGIPPPQFGSPASEVADIAASCVHCGLCNAVCPTFLLKGDERDGPRGRIRLVEQMFARSASSVPPTEEERRHIGRCLSCMACVTACPTGVDYGHLIGHAKAYLRDVTTPTFKERLSYWTAATIVPFPDRLRWLIKMAPLASRISRALRWVSMRDLAALAAATPNASGRRAAFSGPGTAATTRERRGRVILLAGCAQQVLRPGINDSTIRLLARSGIDVQVAAGAGCCGATTSEIGDMEASKGFARANIDAWTKLLSREAVDAIVFNAAGCGLAVKDYPHLLRDDPAYATKAIEIAALAKDVTEFLSERGLGPPRRWSSLKVVHQAPCRLRHGQGVVDMPANLIHEAGFTVIKLDDDGLCCGASGTYAFREPEIAEALRDRKVNHILAKRPDVIATESIACLKHIEPAIGTPVVHTVELLDWAHGGPVPSGLEALAGDITDVPGPPPLDVEDYIRA
ncbi:MAG: glycolate oxidase subunit GlcF [Hyphomicrobiaceae bacterium]